MKATKATTKKAAPKKAAKTAGNKKTTTKATTKKTATKAAAKPKANSGKARKTPVSVCISWVPRAPLDRQFTNKHSRLLLSLSSPRS